MSLKSIQIEFNKYCSLYGLNDNCTKLYYNKRSKTLKAMLKENNWAKAASRYYNLMQQAIELGDEHEACYYSKKYQEAMKNAENKNKNSN